ncbi:hypothetical protein INR49_001418, partial [Caranx melampygus]
CQDFLKKCLTKVPEKRPSLEELHLHPWLSLLWVFLFPSCSSSSGSVTSSDSGKRNGEVVTTVAVIVFVALRSSAAEKKQCPVESAVLTRHWSVHLQQRQRGVHSSTLRVHTPSYLLTCSRKAIGRWHVSHSSSAGEGRPLWLSHAGFPPTLLGNCGERSRHGSASSRKPRTTSAEDTLVPLDIGPSLSLRMFGLFTSYNFALFTMETREKWTAATTTESVDQRL